MKPANNDWFGPKRIGWGWRPLTWQGWIISTVYLLGILYIVFSNNSQHMARLLVEGVLLTMVFAVIALMTGSKPGHKR